MQLYVYSSVYIDSSTVGIIVLILERSGITSRHPFADA